MKEHKSFQLEIKSGDLNEDGTFTGLASTYGNVDQGDDIVVAGAFTKTLQEKGNTRPILWSHKSDKPIGKGYLEDTDRGLVIKGKLNLDIQEARDAYSNLKMGIVQGLSIGFETVKKSVKDGIRHLTELKLFEVSLCVFPMNEMASVQAVKSREEKDDFLEELDEAQTWAFRYMAMSALSESLCETMSDPDLDDAGKSAASSVSIQQFHDKYIEMLPKMTALQAEQQAEYGYYAKRESESKAGRKLSAATIKRIQESVSQLQALLAEAAGNGTSGDGAAMPEAPKAMANTIEPELFHSLMGSFSTSLTGELKWQS